MAHYHQEMRFSVFDCFQCGLEIRLCIMLVWTRYIYRGNGSASLLRPRCLGLRSPKGSSIWSTIAMKTLANLIVIFIAEIIVH